MASHHGKNGIVKFSTNSVGEVDKWSCDESVDTADSTAMGDTARTHIAGIPGWSGSFSAKYDPADTNGQVAATIGASVSLGLYSDGGATGKKYLSGTATITKRTIDADMGDMVKISCEFLGNGALSISTVS